MEKEFAGENIRKNEGEAANYGIFYDDTKYDYMQHLKELGTGSGNSVFIEAKPEKGKGKKSVKLEDAIRDFSLDDSRSQLGGSASVYGSEYAYSTVSTKSQRPTYQTQQDVPDEIAGFQPNMDPRLRETLEALDDEAFAEDADDAEDFFGELTKNAEEVDLDEFERTHFEDEEDGWESDATEKPHTETHKDIKKGTEPAAQQPQCHDPSEMPDHSKPVPDTDAGDWMKEFAKYKKDIKAQSRARGGAPSELSDRKTATSTLFTIGGTPVRKKKRKGALTNPSTYSMTSSSLARTEGQRLLDDRFEKIDALYSLDEEGEYDDSTSMVSGMTGMTGVTGMTGASQAPSLVSRGDYGDVPLRSDYDTVMDEFLSGWRDSGKRAKRKGNRGKQERTAMGMAMLDEIRKELGPARIPSKSRA